MPRPADPPDAPPPRRRRFGGPGIKKKACVNRVCLNAEAVSPTLPPSAGDGDACPPAAQQGSSRPPLVPLDAQPVAAQPFNFQEAHGVLLLGAALLRQPSSDAGHNKLGHSSSADLPYTAVPRHGSSWLLCERGARLTSGAVLMPGRACLSVSLAGGTALEVGLQDATQLNMYR